MLVRLYQFLSLILTPVWHWHLRCRLRKGKEDAARLKERLGHSSRPRPSGTLVWIHAASVGEALSALALMTRLVETFPSLTIMLTSGTVTSAKVIVSHLPSQAFHQFIPIDNPFAVNRFLDHWKPDLVLWFESELWPELLLQIGKRHIPAFLINGRLSDRSYHRWLKFKRTANRLLMQFHTLYAQSQEHAERFKSLGHQTVKILDNLKFAAPPLRYSDAEAENFRNRIDRRPIWLAASTHPGEDEQVIEVHLALKTSFPSLLTLIAPRHPQRGKHIQKLCDLHHLSAQRRSVASDLQPSTEVYIADTLGELGLFFALSPIVFLGGSLVDIGGHNIIEPAHFSCALLQGPHSHNFRATTLRFAEAHAIQTVHSSEELFSRVHALLGAPEDRKAFGEAAHKLATAHHEALHLLMKDLEQWLTQTSPS